MKAAVIQQYGPPENLTIADVPMPTAGAGDVLVKVYAAGINPVDAKNRAGGAFAGRYGENFPMVLGYDVSGVVESVGADVTEFAAGDAVFGMVRFPDNGAAYAEYVAAPAAQFVRKPLRVDHIAAAGVPLAALTAYQALFDTADLQPGQRVLIHAAAGGVGHFAVQLAKWRGATVYGTASTANQDLLAELGVDHSIDYTVAPLASQLPEIDVVLDPLAGEAQVSSLTAIVAGGILVSIVGLHEEAKERAASLGVRAEAILVRIDRAQLGEIAGLIEDGTLRPLVDSVHDLADAAEAHRRIETGRAKGKVVLRVTT